MQAKAEEIDTAEKRGKHAVSIIGCGQTGIQQALMYADAGFKVTCVDADQTLVNRIAKGKIPLIAERIHQKRTNKGNRRHRRSSFQQRHHNSDDPSQSQL
jgi:UDP-glucose 6-dehydrogenase